MALYTTTPTGPQWVGGAAAGPVLFGTYAGRPAPGTVSAGTMYVVSDGSPVVFICDGAAWRPIVAGGPVGVESAPANSLAGYVNVNFQGGTSASAKGGCATITAASNGAGAHRLQGLEVPFAFGQTVLVCMKPWNQWKAQNAWLWGAFLHDTVGGTLESICAQTNTDQNGALPFGFIGNKLDRVTWTDPNTVLNNPNEDITYLGSGELVWFRLRSHGPNQAGASIEGAYSTDGVNFQVYYDVALATPFNRAGFFVDPFLITPGGALSNVTVESFSVA
jgi:hypothetical protein